MMDNEGNKFWNDYVSRYIVSAMCWFCFEKNIVHDQGFGGFIRHPVSTSCTTIYSILPVQFTCLHNNWNIKPENIKRLLYTTDSTLLQNVEWIGVLLLTLLRIISGARYSGVPHSVHVRPFTRLANPKSVICNHNHAVIILAVSIAESIKHQPGVCLSCG